ncbi:MAG TPA: MBL fold metallo-hydrolase [Roseiflexaceae bacterium]|jgi:glyoxylase-like metal-dependent hydrolase (beta-lactamase superfamily II)|nr:MBL fold metallo-hydrolase [Roseiflexaceae bacterium]
MTITFPTVRCHVLDTGYCLASEHHLVRGGARRTIECHSLVALLQHPTHGWLLWDTGYAPRLLDVTRGWPFRLYRVATPLRITPSRAVVDQLGDFGITPRDMRWIICSHFHADHIAGLHDFPDAQFIATRAAYEDVAARRGLQALRRAFVPALMPEDFATRARLLDEPTGPELPALGPTYDLFDDGSLLLVPLPGHARGQVGMLVRTDNRPLFFVADGAWMRRSIREQRPPHPITSLVVDDMDAVRATLERLHAFSAACPDVTLVPTHCPEAYAQHVWHT